MGCGLPSSKVSAEIGERRRVVRVQGEVQLHPVLLLRGGGRRGGGPERGHLPNPHEHADPALLLGQDRGSQPTAGNCLHGQHHQPTEGHGDRSQAVEATATTILLHA